MSFDNPKEPRSDSLFPSASRQPGGKASLSSPSDDAEHARLRDSTFAKRAANVVIVAFFLLLPFLYIFNFRHKFGSSLIGSDHLSSSPSATPSTPAPGSSTVIAPPPAVSLPEPAHADSPQQAAPTDRAAGGSPAASLPAASGDALQALSPPGAPVSGAPTPSISDLWLAVQHGDVDSEVALARLYLSGTGVGKSCEQARVLFSAAAKKGNADAQRELDNLPAQGCP